MKDKTVQFRLLLKSDENKGFLEENEWSFVLPFFSSLVAIISGWQSYLEGAGLLSPLLLMLLGSAGFGFTIYYFIKFRNDIPEPIVLDIRLSGTGLTLKKGEHWEAHRWEALLRIEESLDDLVFVISKRKKVSVPKNFLEENEYLTQIRTWINDSDQENRRLLS